MKAQDYLRKGAELLEQRGKEYDKPEGERSMGKCVQAFNAITGRDLSEAEGWLLLQVLKDVRQWQNPGRFHADSAEDCISYAALKAEALVAHVNSLSDYMGFPSLDSHGLAVEPAAAIDDDSERMQAIGQNGNTGEHYGNAPSWNEAPEWALYLCQDQDGSFCFFEEMPEVDEESSAWMESETSGRVYVISCGAPSNKNWRESLQLRPKKD